MSNDLVSFSSNSDGSQSIEQKRTGLEGGGGGESSDGGDGREGSEEGDDEGLHGGHHVWVASRSTRSTVQPGHDALTHDALSTEFGRVCNPTRESGLHPQDQRDR